MLSPLPLAGEEGKVALVTGAANGIGRSAALVLAREGAKIVATDLQDDKGEGLLRELRTGSLLTLGQ